MLIFDIIILILVLFMLSCHIFDYKKHRIIQIQYSETNFVYKVQENIFIFFWRNMQYAVSPYLERDYEFKTYADAVKFMESLKENKPIIRVMKEK